MGSTVLRGATVIDGTGAPAREANVVINANLIAAVTPAGAAEGDEVIDLDGLVLAPGFIDCHTHFDAQILWDGDLTPSSWHGVTTVVMGNCGFSLAPTRAAHRDKIARTLENVEGMSLEALVAGIPWGFETYPEYLDVIDRLPKRLNVASMIGHTPLRLFVMGEEAVERPATPDEIAQMRDLVGEALDAGAVGFATSKQPAHNGDGGKPVPSRLATFDEISAIVEALRDRNRGVIQATYGPDLFVDQFSQLSSSSGRPLTWTALNSGKPDFPVFDILARQLSLPGEVYPQMACRPIVMQVTLADPAPLARVASFRAVLAAPHDTRAELYADPDWRVAAREEMAVEWGRRWERISVAETTVHPELVGQTVLDLARSRRTDPVDVMCDLALEDGLETRFQVIIDNHDEAEIARMLAEPGFLLALSDAGAHASQLCDACWSTHLLEHWVRNENALTLENGGMATHWPSGVGLPAHRPGNDRRRECC